MNVENQEVIYCPEDNEYKTWIQTFIKTFQIILVN